jgi:hypothetical protein
MHKKIPILVLSLLAISLVLSSCSKDDNADPTGDAYQGDFVSAVHTTSGSANINQDQTTLSLTKFKTDSGPDLNIYLSASIPDADNDFIDLGDIKGIDGNFTYDLPDNVDYAHYKYVVVWCVAFSVNFGYAELVAL